MFKRALSRDPFENFSSGFHVGLKAFLPNVDRNIKLTFKIVDWIVDFSDVELNHALCVDYKNACKKNIYLAFNQKTINIQKQKN